MPTYSVPVEETTPRIERTPRLSWKTDTQVAFLGALAVTDHPVSQRELHGLTALAFRTRWLYYEGERTVVPVVPSGGVP